jgi:hypothetical protein
VQNFSIFNQIIILQSLVLSGPAATSAILG